MEIKAELACQNPQDTISYETKNMMKNENIERNTEKTLAQIENDVKIKWEEIKNCTKEDVEFAEKFYSEDSTILYVPTSIKCEGIDEIIKVHSYKNYCGISTKELSNEVIINTTVCGNTVTEEKILTILHTRPIQWLLPGVQATGRRIVLPIVTIVTFDEDLLIKNKRLYWDQACVLKQVGLMPSISRCPFNGEDTEIPVRGVQQSDPLLTKEQLEDINSLDIINRYSLKKASIERFKDLRSNYVNKNKSDSVKKLLEEDGEGVEEYIKHDGRRRSYNINVSDSVKKLLEEEGQGVEEYIKHDGRRRTYNTMDFRSKSDTLCDFVSGGIKEEYLNEKNTNKINKKYRNDSKNINEILTESNTDIASNKSSTVNSGSRRMFKEYLYQGDNVFSNESDRTGN